MHVTVKFYEVFTATLRVAIE